MKKEKYLYSYLILFLLVIVGAFIWQLLFPDMAEKFSLWGFSRGWQTKIALWNLGVDIGLVITLAKILTVFSFSLCILLGAHHLIYALTATNSNTSLHWVGTIEVLLIGKGAGIIAINLIVSKSSRRRAFDML